MSAEEPLHPASDEPLLLQSLPHLSGDRKGIAGGLDGHGYMAALEAYRSTRTAVGRDPTWLRLMDPETLHRAQKILGTATERETVEVALDMIAFRRELLDGTRALSGLKIDSIR